MKRKLNNILLLLIPLLSCIPLFAEVVLTDAEYKALMTRLKNDKTIITTDNKRWNDLKTSKPKIDYEVQDDAVVIQKVEIPVYAAASLKYEVKFKIELKKTTAKFFPWTFFLCGTVESVYKFGNGETFKVYPDIKLGVQFFSLKPLNDNLGLGLNVMVGVQSIGGSLSYTFPKVLKNTSIHVYLGLNYKSVVDKSPRMGYGLGISLNF